MKNKNILFSFGMVLPVTATIGIVSCGNKKENNYLSKTKIESSKPQVNPIESSKPQVNKLTVKEEIQKVNSSLKNTVKKYIVGISDENAENISRLLHVKLSNLINYFKEHIVVLNIFKNSSIISDISIIPKYNEYEEMIINIYSSKDAIQSQYSQTKDNELADLLNETFIIILNSSYNEPVKEFILSSPNKDVRDWLKLPMG